MVTSPCCIPGQCATRPTCVANAASRRRSPLRPRCLLSKSSEDGATAALEKEGWQSNVRNLQGRRKHRLWEPVLQDPPPLLDAVCVVLVSPKRPISVGTVARSLSCFECEDLRIVDAQCDHLTRSSRNGSKGAQFLLWRAQQAGSLQEALADCELSVACTRWVAGRPNIYRSVTDLMAAPQVAALLAPPTPAAAAAAVGVAATPSRAGESSNSSIGTSSDSGSTSGTPQKEEERGRGKLALVFGREVSGLTAAEVDACDMSLSIPIGRLQESMSLSHAVSVVLSRLFETRQQAAGYALPQGLADLAAGYEESGVER